jgi:DNA-binding protein HU-beta
MTEIADVVRKADLVDMLAETGAVDSKKAAAIVLDVLFGHIAVEAFHGKKVRVHGFGTFQVKHKPPRKARNPLNGGEVDVPAKDVLTFKASKAGK